MRRLSLLMGWRAAQEAQTKAMEAASTQMKAKSAPSQIVKKLFVSVGLCVGSGDGPTLRPWQRGVRHHAQETNEADGELASRLVVEMFDPIAFESWLLQTQLAFASHLL